MLLYTAPNDLLIITQLYFRYLIMYYFHYFRYSDVTMEMLCFSISTISVQSYKIVDQAFTIKEKLIML